jgi:hypothetical protein
MATKVAPKKGAKKGAKNNTQVRSSRIEVVSEPTIQLVEGIPLSRLHSTPEEQQQIINYLRSIQINKQHLVVPARLKSTVLRIAGRDFPQYKMRTAVNADKKTVSIWRTK